MKVDPEFKKRIDEKIDQFLAEKRFNEAAILAAHMALISIDPQELTNFLVNAVREYQEKRKNTANPHGYPYFCFPCGRYHDDIQKHQSTKTHQRNERRWRTSMGYRKKWSRRP